MMVREMKINQAVSGLERSLENALDAAFRPVGPRPEYMNELRGKLMLAPDRPSEDEQLLKMMLGGVGVISALLLILASVKLVQNWRRGETKRLASQRSDW